jgi:cupin 2 domain-containing protein
VSDPKCQLWRQDDNGQRFLIGSFASRDEAEARQQELQSGGHKQIYWIETQESAVANLFAAIPADLPEELFTPLLARPGLKLERIVSRGHVTPPGQWYDQEQAEWVLLVSGSAVLRLTEPDETLRLQPGDHLLIPAHRRHRVEETVSEGETVWLALHLERNG